MTADIAPKGGAPRSRAIAEIHQVETKKHPHNAEVEQALLGAILRTNKAYEKVADYLLPHHFYVPEHIVLFRHIQQFIKSGKDANPATLSHVAQGDDILQEAGGTAYLYELATNLVSIMNAADYGKQIYDLHLKRELIGMATDLLEASYSTEDFETTSETLIEQASDHLLRLISTNVNSKIKTLGEAIAAQVIEYDRIAQDPENGNGIRCNLAPVDNMTLGFRKAKFVLLAGRPGMAKTALALFMANGMAEQCEPDEVILFFSLEMDAEELAERVIGAGTSTNPYRAKAGKLTPHELNKIIDYSRDTKFPNLFIDDRPAQTIAGMNNRIRELSHKFKVRAVYIDYLQLITPSADGRRYANRNNEVSEISRDLKTMAKQWDIPVIALSQLSRDVEKRDDKRPQLSDLRDSGSLEQDADIVGFLYRDEYYAEREEPQQKQSEGHEAFQTRYTAWMDRMERSKNVLQVIFSKHRGGPVGTVDLYCDLTTMTFGALHREEPAQGGFL